MKEQDGVLSVLDSVVGACKRIHLPPVRLESQVVDAIRKEFRRADLSFEEEVTVAPRCRVDFVVEGAVAVEVKKGKPNSRVVSGQIERYAAAPMVEGVVLVSERGLIDHLEEAHGKPVRYVALAKNWGIAL